MSLSKRVVEALSEGLRDHPHPMGIADMIAFLEGYGVELDPRTAPSFLRLVMTRSGLFEAVERVGRQKRYQLKEPV